jgi:hypothetical protein
MSSMACADAMPTWGQDAMSPFECVLASLWRRRQGGGCSRAAHSLPRDRPARRRWAGRRVKRTATLQV